MDKKEMQDKITAELKDRYDEALGFLYSQLPMFSRVGAAAYKPGLDTSLRLDEYFGHPHRKFKSIHVGGTNGKGSTSHLIASVLQSEGYKVGLYTSPHLVDFRERMRINGKMISKEKVVEFIDRWKESGYEGKPSFFELTMMMAFDWFAREKVDYAVIEVGMGGRLDSTNIITPLISVITNISHDHNQFLGSTLTEIAGEKAGIIKAGIPVVVGERQQECQDVFISKASETDSPLTFAADSNLEKEITADSYGDWRIEWKGIEIKLPLRGDYQKKNLVTVLTVLDELRKSGIEIKDESISEGIGKVVELTGFAGRWTILNEHPLTIADTGHNIAGLTYNLSQLQRLMEERRDGKLRVVIGFVADKAIDKILTVLPQDAIYYVTNAKIPRALPAEDLQKLMEARGLKTQRFDNVVSAYDAAKKEASEKDVIFIGGSTFIVADLLSEM